MALPSILSHCRDLLGNLGLVYANRASRYADLGEVRAIECYGQHLTIARAIGDQRGEANESWNLELVVVEQGDLARTAALMQVFVDYEQAIGHPDATKHAAYLARVRRRLAGQRGGRRKWWKWWER